MIPRTIEELNKVKEMAKKKSTKSGILSATAGIVPIPGVDAGTDLAILLNVLPKINQMFGLSPEQIDKLDVQIKTSLLKIIKKSSADFVGKYITKELILQIFKKLGIRITTKQVVKYVPIIGQIICATISFASISLIINSHINECYNVCKELIENQGNNKILLLKNVYEA